MSQKYIKSQNKNRDSQAFGKYFATVLPQKKLNGFYLNPAIG